MIIELYGIPGSGKTTLAKELVRRNKDRFIYLHSSPRREIIRLVPLFAIRHPRIAAFWFRELLRETFRGRRVSGLFRYKLHLLLITLAQYQKALRYQDKVIVLDEGLLQRIFSVYDTALPRGKIENCIRHTPKADILVRVCRKADRFRRVLRAPYTYDNPRVNAGKIYLKNWMSGVLENDKIICGLLQERNAPVVWLQDSQDVNSSLELILRYYASS